ncbi:uncharacterized protein LOC110100751 [Dendrobium catenatum]|uniref:uncharacterized protein LOC110100751 n=1 Tax=Dendrobium catenatum TaxID=906689 RepID=UPI0009F1D28B|nr:uncharacterized protein LOC110100751 [Dendrobium catenatum]
MFITVALHHDWSILQLDVVNAFLHGNLTETIYMSQPQGFQDPQNPTHVCKLHKALYGLKQAPRQWFATLSSFLHTIGFHISSADPSFFIYNQHGIHIYLLIYVDDILISGSDSQFISNLLQQLQQKFQIRNLGMLSQFLGITFTRSPTEYHLTQQSYLEQLLSNAAMSSCKPLTTPLLLKWPTDPNLQANYTQQDHFRHIVGSLQFLTNTRPDIAFAVNKICQHMHQPSIGHFQLLKRILIYLKGTTSLGLFLPKTDLNLTAFADSDWAGDAIDRKSTTGYCIFLGSALISWSVKKQSTVARSSTEAEYRSLAASAADVIWLRRLCQEFSINLPSTPLYCDNISAMSLASNPIFHARTKHIEIDHHFIRDCVQAKHIIIHHVSSVDQIADIFTKPLHSQRLAQLRSKLLVLPHTSLKGTVNDTTSTSAQQKA